MTKTSQARLDAQKRYREKHSYVQIAIQYQSDVIEGKRLKSYLRETGQAANAYVKTLIKKDLDEKGIPYPKESNPE